MSSAPVDLDARVRARDLLCGLHIYTSEANIDAIVAALEAAERRGIERAAEVCEERGARYRTTARTNRATAKAIRALEPTR